MEMRKKQRRYPLLVLIMILSALVTNGCRDEGEEDRQAANITTSEESLLVEEIPSSGEGTAGETAPSEDTEENAGKEDASSKISLVMVGDILLHDRVEESAVQADGSRDFSAIFSETGKTISDADLAIVNQEVIIGGSGLGISGYPAFNAPYEIGDALAETGFDVVCHATNHALDKGKKGILNCIDFWRTNYPQMGILGIHDSSEEQDDIYIFEKDGIKIAILNYTYGTNGISLPSDMPYAVDMLEEEKVISDIQKAEAEADFTIVCPHWGTEYQLTPSAQQKKWSRIFLEQGVDLVLGTHPHVIEPVEWLTDEATDNKMLVYYSLGNYVNWTSGTGAGVSNRMVGGMATVTLEKKSETEPVEISEYGVEALVCHVRSGSNGVRVYPLGSYTQELAAENEIISQAPDFTYRYCVDLCDKVWGDLWKQEVVK